MRFFQLLLQLCLDLFVLGQVGFQVTPLAANLVRLLLGRLPGSGFRGQRFRQPADLSPHFCFRRLQLLDACFEPGFELVVGPDSVQSAGAEGDMLFF